MRVYLGRGRLDTVAQTDGLNALYDQMWGYYTLFQSVLRLREKVRAGQRVIRRWDTAQTPLARLLATEACPPAARQRLRLLQRDQNPRALRQAIYRDLARLLGQPVARITWDRPG